jgi:hypothetical protein
MCLVRAPDGVGRRLGQPEVAHLALGHQLGHRADRLLDRRARVHPVLVVEVDVIRPQAAQRRLARLVHVLRAPVDTAIQGIVPAHDPELGGEHDLVAAAGDGASHQLLVVSLPVHVRRVEQLHAQVQGAVDDADRLLVVDLAVELGHAHQTEADLCDLESLRSQLSLFHDCHFAERARSASRAAAAPISSS